jgi:hypothetical protein
MSHEVEAVDPETEATFQALRLRSPSLKRPVSYLLYNNDFLTTKESVPPTLIPLKYCILGIQWEFSVWDGTEELGDRESRRKEFILLRAAALYQANFESVSNSISPLA